MEQHEQWVGITWLKPEQAPCDDHCDPSTWRDLQKVLDATPRGWSFRPLLVFVELARVLKAAPGWDATRVHDALGRLLNMEGVAIPRERYG
jgi:hypothetical protein